jgi:hypothetical protein
MIEAVRCKDCGALVPDVPELRTGHLYVGAAPGCWAAYTELIGRQMSEPGLGEARSLSVDVYMAQHPGVAGRQASQSVWVHLVGLCLSLEHGYGGEESARAKTRLAIPNATFEWLEPPAALGSITVLDVLSTANSEEHQAAVLLWAKSVWAAWAPHQVAIRKRAESLLGRSKNDSSAVRTN